jgi:hypothetical protein
MWMILDRARRLVRVPRTPDSDRRLIVTSGEAPSVEDVDLAIGRPELERLAATLERRLGKGVLRPDSPARLEAALRTLIDRVAGTGQPSVTRRPPGIHTPETWQVRIDGADARTRIALDDALERGGIV